jgi:hypothetical protein
MPRAVRGNLCGSAEGRRSGDKDNSREGSASQLLDGSVQRPPVSVRYVGREEILQSRFFRPRAADYGNPVVSVEQLLNQFATKTTTATYYGDLFH